MRSIVTGREHRHSTARRLTVAALAAGPLVTGAWAQQQGGLPHPLSNETYRGLLHVIPMGTELSTLYADGSEIEVEIEDRWRFICGSDVNGMTVDVLAEIAERNYQAFEDGPVIVVDSGVRGAGVDIVYNLDGTVPSQAVSGFGIAEAYLESLFSDAVTVNVNCDFANLGGGVIGATGSSYVSNISYTNSRNGLTSGMDSNDSIQSFLPSGSSMPVRYDGSSGTVSNETLIDWTRGNYRAGVGTSSGTCGSMTYNSTFTFDYNPANGISGGALSFVDVVIHETGHAMGFVSSVDFGGDANPLDMFRFQRTDGAGDYNPDTTGEFSTTARLIDFNNPNDDHNSDIITAEHRMSDGSPYQASHFREQGANIGLMDPALSGGETHYPNYFSTADFNMFDAIGWDYPPCSAPNITQQPQPADVCTGETIVLSVTASGGGLTYQWRIGSTDLVNGGRISGATTATLTITNAQTSDAASNYNCVVSLSGCPTISDNAAVTVAGDAVFINQPQDANVPEGGSVQFNILVEGFSNYTYQWQRNGVDLVNGGAISGATTQAVNINPVQPGDAGSYRCVVTSIAAGCDTLSDSATLSVFTSCTPPSITQQPASDAGCQGETLQLSVAATGVSLTYQWRIGTTNLTNDGHYSGTTTATLTISNATPADNAANYNCVISSAGACPVTSSNASITVTAFPSISQQPVSQDVCEDGTIGLSVTASGSSLTYQWRRGTTDLVDNGRISGSTTASLSISNAVPGDAGSDYNCVITAGGQCTVVSNNAAVTVEGPANILSDPSDLTVDEGDPASFTVSVQSPGSYTYQWRKDDINLSDGGTISGSTTATLSISASVQSDAGSYDCVITSGIGCVTISDSAQLTVNAPEECPQDLDGDGQVGLSDLSALLENFGGPGGPEDGDFDGDGQVGLSDLSALLEVFGTACP